MHFGTAITLLDAVFLATQSFLIYVQECLVAAENRKILESF